jgi:sugar phosphate isomerase/epimerase
MNMMKNQSRRRFLETAAMATAGVVIGNATALGASRADHIRTVYKGVQIGVITYSFRSMPDGIAQVVQYCKNSGVNAVELMGDPAEKFAGGSIDKFRQIRKMFDDAGVSIYGYKPRGFGAKNSDAELDYAFGAAKILGANQVTLEFPGKSDDTKRLGAAAEKHKIYVGYHGHTQQTFEMWDEALQQSKYNAINLDIGHYVAAGFDPIPLIKAKHDRIVSIHVKDRKSKDHGGENMPWGEGDTPIAEVLKLMSKEKYKFPATIELEYDIPADSDAVKEVAKCLEYAKKALG